MLAVLIVVVFLCIICYYFGRADEVRAEYKAERELELAFEAAARRGSLPVSHRETIYTVDMVTGEVVNTTRR